MQLAALKQAVYEGNMALVKHGLVILTWGNVSAINREEGVVVIKPRGIDYDLLTADDMSVTDLDGNFAADNRYLPSVDLDIHLEIYRSFPGVQAIAHTHSTAATAWAQTLKPIPVYGTTHADHFYGDIPCTGQLTEEQVSQDYERHIGKAIVACFSGIDPLQRPAVLVGGHGPFTWGTTIKACVEHSLILEELAKSAILTRSIDPLAGNLPRYMLDRHYLRKYGKDAYFYQDVIK